VPGASVDGKFTLRDSRRRSMRAVTEQILTGAAFTKLSPPSRKLWSKEVTPRAHSERRLTAPQRHHVEAGPVCDRARWNHRPQPDVQGRPGANSMACRGSVTRWHWERRSWLRTT